MRIERLIGTAIIAERIDQRAAKGTFARSG